MPHCGDELVPKVSKSQLGHLSHTRATSQNSLISPLLLIRCLSKQVYASTDWKEGKTLELRLMADLEICGFKSVAD